MSTFRSLIISAGQVYQIADADSLNVGAGIERTSSGSLGIGTEDTYVTGLNLGTGDSVTTVDMGTGSGITTITLGDASMTPGNGPDIILGGDVEIKGNETVVGTVTFTGDMQIGDASSDTLTIVAQVAGDIVFKNTGDHIIKVDAVTGDGVAGKMLDIYSGEGGPGTTGAGGTGGTLGIRGGTGGDGTASYDPGDGGSIGIAGGAGGTGGTGNADGGSAYVRGGAGQGTGTDGSVYIGDSNTDSVELAAVGVTTYVNDALSVAGDVDLGDNSTDTISFTGSVDTDILPLTDSTYDLGSSTKRWAESHVTNIYVRGDNTDTDKVLLTNAKIQHTYPSGTGTFLVSSMQATTASAAGNAIAIASGQGGDSVSAAAGDGGALDLVGGEGGDGTSSYDPGAGGDVSVVGGAGGTGGSGNADGGDVYVRGGLKQGNAANGTIYIGDSNTATLELATAGVITSVNGSLTVDGDTDLGDNAADSISFVGSVDTDVVPMTDNTYDLGTTAKRWAEMHVGGTTGLFVRKDDTNTDFLQSYFSVASQADILFTMPGAQGTLKISCVTPTSPAPGHNVTVESGTGLGGGMMGAGGQLSLTAGAGGAAATTAAFTGGSIVATAGTGGAGSATRDGATGGSVTISAGDGGAGTGTTLPGQGGDVTVEGGNEGTPGGGGNALPGNVYIRGGAGANADGYVYLGETNTDGIGVGGMTVSATNHMTINAGWELDTTSSGNIDLPNNGSARFKIEGTGVGATVTAANLDTLTDGSNADALHIHAVAGAASDVDVAATAGEALASGQAVIFDDDAGNPRVFKAQAGGAGQLNDCCGICSTAAADEGSTTVRVAGEILVPDAYWASATPPGVADVGKRVYLHTTAGQLSTTAPSGSGEIAIRIGWVSKGGSGVSLVLLGIGEGVIVP